MFLYKMSTGNKKYCVLDFDTISCINHYDFNKATVRFNNRAELLELDAYNDDIVLLINDFYKWSIDKRNKLV